MSLHNPDWLSGDCRHYWRIESPNGPTSRGRCLRCGRERRFDNSGERPRRSLPAADRAAIAQAKREEAAIQSIIKNFGSEGYVPLNRFRRNLRSPDD